MITVTDEILAETHSILRSKDNTKSMLEVETEVLLRHGAAADDVIEWAKDVAFSHLVLAIRNPDDRDLRANALSDLNTYEQLRVKLWEQG